MSRVVWTQVWHARNRVRLARGEPGERALARLDGRGRDARPYGVRPAPRLDVVEAPTYFRVELEAPGRAARDLAVEVDDRTLFVRAEGPQGAAGRTGPRPGACRRADFERRVHFGAPIDVAGVRARYQDGVLSVHVPRESAAERIRTVPVTQG